MTLASDHEPLWRPVPPTADYPVDSLGPIVGNATRALHEIVQAPLAICGQSVLAAASLAAQSHADVSIDGRKIPLSLWAISIGGSGERKTAVDLLALAPHAEYEREQIARREAERRRYDIDSAVYERKLSAAARGTRDQTAEAVREVITALGDAPKPPRSGILIAHEPTLAALRKLYLTGVGSLGLFSSEGAVWFGGYSMSPGQSMRTIAAYSTLWDRGESDRIRAGDDGANKIYDRRLAMHLMIQPVVAERVLSDPLLSGQGFLARALITWPITTAGTRTYRAIDSTRVPALREYHARMHSLLRYPVRERDGRPGELTPVALTLTPAARQTWIAAYDKIEREMTPGAAYSSIQPWASKGPEQILRVAGVLSLVDKPDGEIDASAIEAATKLVNYYLGEAVRIVDTARIPQSVRDADAIYRWCSDRQLPEVESRTLLQQGPNRIRVRAVLDQAMAHLERAGWATPTRRRGKAVTAWAVRSDASGAEPTEPASPTRDIRDIRDIRHVASVANVAKVPLSRVLCESWSES